MSQQYIVYLELNQKASAYPVMCLKMSHNISWHEFFEVDSVYQDPPQTLKHQEQNIQIQHSDCLLRKHRWCFSAEP